MAATVEAQFILRSDADAKLAAMETQATRTEAAYTRLGATMDTSMARGGRSLEQSGMTATRSAATHEAAARRTEKAWTATGSTMVKMGRNVSLGLLGMGVAAVDFATKFEKATTQFNTQAGASVEQTAKLKAGILDMAAAVGATPDQLAGGMYHVVSSMNSIIPKAQRVSTELGILREAAKGAAIGGSNVTETAYALSSAMNALGVTGIPGAKKTMAELNAIVGSGDMHMQDLVSALSSGIVSASKTFGISLQSVGAALAYMTDRGVPAQQAATRLRMSIALLGAPTKQSAGILEGLGLTYSQVELRQNGLSKALQASGVTMTDLSADLRKPDGIMVALQDLKDHMTSMGVSTSAQADIIARAFGGGRSGGSIMAMFNNLPVLAAKYGQQTEMINHQSSDWAKTQHTLAFELHQVEAGAEMIGIKLGTVLIPWVEKGIGEGEKFVSFLEHNKKAAEALAITIGTVLTAAIAAFAINSVRRIATVGREFFNFGRTLANLPGTISSRVSGAIGGGTAAEGAMSAGVRSEVGWGSLTNPVAVVVVNGEAFGVPGVAQAGARAEEAAATSGGAAGYVKSPSGLLVPTGAAGGAVAAGAAEEEAAGLTLGQRAKATASMLRRGAGSVLGGAAGAAGAGGMAFIGTQMLGQLIPGGIGHEIGRDSLGAAGGAAVGSLAGMPWLGAAVGMAVQALSHQPTLVNAALRGAASPGVLGFRPPTFGLGSTASGTPGNPAGFVAGLISAATSKQAPSDAQEIQKFADKARHDLAKHLWNAAVSDAYSLGHYYGPVPSGSPVPSNVTATNRAATSIRNTALTGSGEQAAHDWTASFLKGIAKDDPNTAAGSAAISEKAAQLSSGIKANLDKLTPQGRLAMATAMDAWASQMEAKTPAVKKPMDDLQSGLSKDMDKLHDHIVEVNGQVYSKSSQQWKSISTAITDPMDQAQQKLAGTFSTIKAEAVGALEAMGYNPAQAQRIVASMVGGKASPTLVGGGVAHATHVAGKVTAGITKGFAGGGRVPGAITGDSWSLVDPQGNPRGYVGGGELLISNRHTEAAASAATMAMYGKTMGQMVAGESRSHLAPGYATGGIFQGIGVNTNQSVPSALVNSPLMKAFAALFGGLGGGGGGGAIPGGMGGTPSANQALGKRMMVAAGWPASQWPYLNALWTRESGWSDTAVNPTSGAAGIAQSLGHGPVQLGVAGPQIGWGLNYIKGRYGSPQAAWGHEEADGWYDKGGRARWGGWHGRGASFTATRPTVIGVGEMGDEDVSIRPRSHSTAGGGGGVTIEVRIDRIENHREGDIAKIVERELIKVAQEMRQEHGKVPMGNELDLFR